MAMQFFRWRAQSSAPSKNRLPKPVLRKHIAAALRFAVESLEQRTLLTIVTPSVDLSLNGQSLFGTASSTELNFAKLFPLLQWSAGSNDLGPILGLSASGSIGAGQVGLELKASGGLGSANIGDYPVQLQLSAPGSAAPGSTITVLTSSKSNAGSYELSTTATTLPTAELDLVLGDDSTPPQGIPVNASLTYQDPFGGSHPLFSPNPSISFDVPLINVAGGQFSGLLDYLLNNDSSISPILNTPDLPSLDSVATVGTPATPSDIGNVFAGVSADLSPAITALTGVPLETPEVGVKGFMSVQGDLEGINLVAGLTLTEAVSYTPETLITLTSSDGQTHSGVLGQSFDFTMPQKGALDLSASLQLGGTLQTTIGLGGKLSLDLDLLELDATVLGTPITFGPILSHSFQLAAGTLFNLPPLSFPLSSSTSIAPVQSISNIVMINSVDGTPVAPPAWGVTSVNPASFQVSTARQEIQIFGSGFTTSSTLQFTFDNGSPIASTAQYLDTSKWASGEIDYSIATGTAAGSWTVQVVNNGVASSAFAFSTTGSTADTTPPTATLDVPANGVSVQQSAINSGGVILVSFSDVGSGVNSSTITDSAAEFALSGAGVGTASVNGAATFVSGSIYSYKFTGSFGTGAVTVTFTAGSFADLAGNGNIASTQSFTVTSSTVATGAIQETITSQAAINAGAQWNVDGGSYQNSGSVVTGLAEGVHTVQFKPISGWNAPPTQSVTVAAGQTSSQSATYAQQSAGPYSLLIYGNNGNVTRNPNASVYAAGTVVTLTASPDLGYHFSSWSGGLSGAQNPITFAVNSNLSITANYAAGDLTHGSLQVSISPQNSIASGAKWSIDGGAWLDSGTTVTGIGAGQTEIDFLPISGFFTPTFQFVTITGGQTTTYTAQYTPLVQTGSLQVSLSPQSAIVAGANWRVDGGAWLSSTAVASNLSAGNHLVDFEPINGWIAPTSETVQVNDNQTTIVSGTYNPPTGAPIIASVSPNIGPLTAGMQVLIQGANFLSPATVAFGGIAAINVVVNSSTQITATVPARASYGTVPVAVTTPDGSTTDANGFTYAVPRGNNIQLLGQIGGSVTAVTTQGQYAYIGEGSSLAVMDLSNVLNPAVVGTVPLPSVINGIVVSGAYAYVADSDGGLQIVDVSTPSAPLVYGFYDTAGPAEDVAVLGHIAYVAASSGGLQILDVSNPAAPVLISTEYLNGAVADVAVQTTSNGTFAYVADGATGLQIVDVGTAGAPVLRGMLPISSALHVLVQGTTAYVSNGFLEAINVANPDVPALLGTCTAAGCYEFAISNGIAYASNRAWISELNVSNPALMTLSTTSSSTAGGINCCTVYGNNVLVGMGGGLSVISGSFPMNQIGQYASPIGFADTVYSVGTLAYVMAQSQLEIIDMTNPSQPVELGSLVIQGAGQGAFAQQLQVVNGVAYVAGSSGLSIVSVANPSSPTLLGTYLDPNVNFLSVDVIGNLAYIGGGYYGGVSNNAPKLDIVDVSNPASPILVGSNTSVPPGVWDRGIAISGGNAFLVDQNGSASGEMRIVNVSNPNSPSNVTSIATDAEPFSIAVSTDGQYAYVGEAGELEVFDISTPSSAKRLGTFSFSGGANCLGVMIDNGLVYVAATTAGIQALDATDPTNLELVSFYEPAWTAFGMSVSGDVLDVASGAGGVETLKLLDYTPPMITVTNPTGGQTFATSNGTFGIGGTASDNMGVTAVDWSNSQGGSGIATGTTSWSASAISLNPGHNIITVTAMDAAGNETSSTLTVTYTPAQSGQTITFGLLANHTFGDAPFSLNATSSSGLSVSYSVVSGPATVNGNILTLTGAGAVTIAASQTGNTFYSAATSIEQSFTAAKANQTIVLSAPSGLTLGGAPFFENATADSGLPVTLSLVSGPAILSGNLVTITGAGTIVLQGSQAGNINYNAATNTSVSITVAQANQVISFSSLSNQSTGDASFPLIATSSSGLPVAFGIVSGPATLAGNILTVTGAGTVTVGASQAGGGNYNSAPSVDQSFSVVSPVIVDDPQATLIGAWTSSTSNAGYYGTDYLTDGNTAKGTKSATFTPSLAIGGYYNVYARWTSSTNRATNVPYDVTSTTGTSTVIENQQTQGGIWVLLGNYHFNSGTGGSVTIRTTGTNGYVIADAIEFVLAPPSGLLITAAYGFGGNTGSNIMVINVPPVTILSGGEGIIGVSANHANRILLDAPSLSFGGGTNNWQGLLDLTNNDLIVQNGNLTDITNQLKVGFNAHSDYWNGAGGIISSAAAGDATHLTTLGSRQSDGSAFDGVNTTSSDVLVKYTYYGDANLDGVVNGADYQQIDNGFGAHLSGWSNGDFNYDGVVDGSDYSLIDNAFNQITATGAAPLELIARPAVSFSTHAISNPKSTANFVFSSTQQTGSITLQPTTFVQNALNGSDSNDWRRRSRRTAETTGQTNVWDMVFSG